MNSSSIAAMNPRWLAPELFDGEKPTKACDIFSFGVIMWELLTFEVPWGSQNPWVIVNRLQSGERLQVKHDPGVCSSVDFQQYFDLMNHCWQQDKDDRPTIQGVKKALESIK